MITQNSSSQTSAKPLISQGYDVNNHQLIVNPAEAILVRRIFRDFAQLRSPTLLVKALVRDGVTSKTWTTQKGRFHPGRQINKPLIYKLIRNRIFLGEIRHRDRWYPGEHVPIIEQAMWDKAQAVIAVDPKRRANQTRARESVTEIQGF